MVEGVGGGGKRLEGPVGLGPGSARVEPAGKGINFAGGERLTGGHGLDSGGAAAEGSEEKGGGGLARLAAGAEAGFGVEAETAHGVLRVAGAAAGSEDAAGVIGQRGGWCS
jgi:hypothetical protein